MATIDLPEHILQALSNVLQQLQQNLPELKQETDFSASAFKWQDQQLKAIQQPKKMYLNDLKGIERQKEKVIQNTLQFLKGQNRVHMRLYRFKLCFHLLGGTRSDKYHLCIFTGLLNILSDGCHRRKVMGNKRY